MLIVALYMCTFIVILPIKCRYLGFSSYFLSDNADDEIKRQNKVRWEQSLEYLKTHQNEFGGQDVANEKKEKAHLHICTSILTTKRYFPNGYLIQTVAKLAKETKKSRFKFDLKIVNAGIPPEENKEVIRLKEFGFGTEVLARGGKSYEFLLSMNNYEKHRLDLIEALKICDDVERYKYSLVLEDDAFASSNFASVFDYIVDRLPEDDSVGFVKLYHPEKWQGFGYDTKLELFIITCVSFVLFFGNGLLIVGVKDISVKTLFAIFLATVLLCGYVLTFCYTFSRQHLIELFKFWKRTHFITNSPGCCTSAVLYRTSMLSEFIKFLEKEVTCNHSYPIDLVPYDYCKNRGLDRLQVIPSLFFHIGYFSSVQSGTKTVSEFFHLYPAQF